MIEPANIIRIHDKFMELVQDDKFESALKLVSHILRNHENDRTPLTPEQLASFKSSKTMVEMLLRKQKHLDETNRLAFRSQKTGLLNENYINPRLKRLFERVQNEHSIDDAFTVLFLDINFLKTVNDMSEDKHTSGDALLAAFGKFLASAVRPRDLAIHKHGDEFLVVTKGAVGEVIKNNILDKIEAEEVNINGIDIPLRTAIGYVEVDHDNFSMFTDWKDVINKADVAMTHHKEEMKSVGGLPREATLNDIIAYRNRIRAQRSSTNDNTVEDAAQEAHNTKCELTENF